VSYDESWDFQRFARVGIALAEGPAQLNESSKIYQYLRAGLPVVSEEPIPNNTLLEETGMGLVVPYDDLRTLADGIQAVIHSAWPGEAAGEYLAKNHSWDRRAKKYADWLGEDPGERLLLSAIPDKDSHCPA
jgi:glycosyltransferase involved in cell wall biosynthesis